MSAARPAKSASKKGAGEEPPKSPVLPVPRVWLDRHLENLTPVLRHWRDTGKIAPVVLLTGIPGVGKRELAYSLAQWIFCERAGFAKPSTADEEPSLFGGPAEPAIPAVLTELGHACGECLSCQKALHGSWVDFAEIGAESDDDEDGASGATPLRSSGTLKIEQFRDLKSTQGFGGYDGGYRITLIRDADRMTPQAANSVLKLLEEPPPNWILFLTANDPSQLLPTLVSRCQVVRLRPLGTTEVLAYLTEQDVPADRAQVCAALAEGSPRKALMLAQDETWEKRLQVLKFLDTPHTEVGSLIDWAATDPANLQVLLDQLEQALGELLRWSLAPKGHAFSQKPLATYASSLKGDPATLRPFWTERAERIFRARQEALTPMNKKLLIQDLLIPFCR